MHPRDLKKVSEQLGRVPTGALGVVARTVAGNPAVICVDPLNGGNPFPTLFWLTCPRLKKEISHLEREGMIDQWERDGEMMVKLEEDHLRYQEMRMSLLKERHPDWCKLPSEKMRILQETGVGGVRNLNSIKCLHAHYAHFLADYNIVGERVQQSLKQLGR